MVGNQAQPTKARILFVDDEPVVLSSLQHVFRRDRTRWELVFALGGELALDEIRKQPFDVVVSDMRMPGMDGATLLNLIKEECPQTVRIMLTGHAADDAVARAMPALHELLAKPCSAAELRDAIERNMNAQRNN